MIGMILVDNSPHPYWFLDHAEWNGVTPADFIFPSFLFIMGMAVPLAMSKSNPFRARSLFRIIALFGIGVLINLSSRKFNFHHCTQVAYFSPHFGNPPTNQSLLRSPFFGARRNQLWREKVKIHWISFRHIFRSIVHYLHVHFHKWRVSPTRSLHGEVQLRSIS